jgi:nucleotide-binding universal stress UspA family protein
MSPIRRIIAGVSGRPGCLPALRYAADLARAWDAAFVPVHAWLRSGPELAVCQLPYDHLGEEENDAAWQRLWCSLEMAFGGFPPDAQPLASRGSAGVVLVGTASRAGDVLVIGTGRRGAVSRLRHGTVSRYCLAHAGCPVIAIPPPELDRAVARGVRGWRRRQAPGPHAIIPGAPRR